MPAGDVRLVIIPPTGGIRSDLPRHRIPDGFLSDGQNVLCRDGVILVRPGMSALTTAPSANRVMGGVYYKDHAGTDHTLIGTTAGFLSFDGTNWSSITGGALTGTADNHVRFAVFILAGSTTVIAVNDVDATQSYTGVGNFAALAGSPPIAKCATVAFQRVILGNVTVGGTRYGSSLWPSGFQTPTSWNSADIVNLPDTGDTIVEVKSLSDQVFVIYKDRSQWVGIGAGNLFPFIFELKDRQVGPVSPAVVVQAEDNHYYIGQDGDVYQFDGNKCKAIGGYVRRLVQSDIDFVNSGRAHGFFDEINREIWWIWPSFRSVDGFGGIVYRLPYNDVPGAFSPLLVFGVIPTASFAWKDTQTFGWDDLSSYTWDSIATTYATWDSFPNKSKLSSLVGLSTGQVSRFGQAAGDNGTTFDAYWDIPFRPLAGDGKRVRLSAIEANFKRPPVARNADIILLTSDTLGDDGTVAQTTTIDISSSSILRATYYDQEARFVSVRHRLSSTVGLQEYRGGTIYVYPKGEAIS